MLYNVMFYGGLVLFFLFLIATVVLFFVLKIPKALGVITGQTQKKAIEEIKSGTIPSGRRSRTKGSAILARDVGGKVLDKSGAIPKKSRNNDKRSSDASDKLAEKAIEDARVKAAQQAKEAEEKAAKSREEDDTELLKYSETKKKKKQATGEEATAVLDEEQPTDVLDREGSEAIKTAGGSIPGVDEEDDTDVLEKAKKNYNEEEDVTDVLRTKAVSTNLEISEEEESKTDVLTADIGSTLSENDIYGVYNPEMTAVLRSDMAPGEDSIRTSRSNVSLEGITVLYSETIVHTNESL